MRFADLTDFLDKLEAASGTDLKHLLSDVKSCSEDMVSRPYRRRLWKEMARFLRACSE